MDEREDDSTDAIEITPKMLAIGAAVLDDLPLTELAAGWYSKTDAAREVYLAMRRVALGFHV